MRVDYDPPRVATLRDQLRVVRRRAWLIALAAIGVPVLAVAFSLRQERLYEATANVLISQDNVAQRLAGIDSPVVTEDSERYVRTQADLAESPRVVDRVIEAVKPSGGTLGDTDVSPKQDANVLVFRVRNGDPDLARRAVNEYARQFIAYRRESDARAIRRALEQVEKRIQQLRSAGADPESNLFEDALEKQQDLETALALQESNVSLLREARRAWTVQPKPVRNGLLGLALGIILAIGLAALAEALDTRLRSADEIAERAGLRLLGRVPRPPGRVRRKNRLVMLDEPDGQRAEPFRMLRMSLDFANLDSHHRSIVVTSAGEKEGKSTTVANLAVALARGGRRVALIDLDLRRPSLASLFGLARSRGVTDVALGRAELDEVMFKVPLDDPVHAVSERTASTNGHNEIEGLLEVLPAGAALPHVGDFLSSRRLAELLTRLRERSDIVLIDAPPVLPVGDVLTLSANVDAIVLVVRLDTASRSRMVEIRRLLEGAPTAKLGFVLTGSEREEEYGYYGYESDEDPSVREREPVG